MIRLLVALLSVLGGPSAELADGARRAAPSYLTEPSALANAGAAVFAGTVYDVDPALLLSIAWHESRYAINAVTLEVGGKVSCGVMTPVPQASCPVPSMLGGYLAGAAHVRTWIDAARGNVRLALVGVAGGYHLISFCAAGGEHRGCHVADVFLERAALIKARRGTT